MATVASSSISNDAAQPERYSIAESILGADAFNRINKAKVLVVGAGGIGCELLKNLVLTGFDNIEIIDLDTIDLSNLNRQFLFQKQHIKKPKSIVAKQTASSFNPIPNIVAHHANIKEPQFGVAYFQRFDLVMNALDNLDARRWVNKMCIAADVPLIESGTTGFLGQVQPIKRGVTECYDCIEKPTPKTFPVCTIRSTPSTPIHCIVWAKSWLFTQLFGADDETEDAELDKAIADGEDAKEIDSLRKEAREMRDIRASLVEAAQNRDQDAIRTVAERIFNKVYKNDIERLLGMEEMWTHRPVKPVPLVFQDALSDVTTPSAETPASASNSATQNLAANTASTNNSSSASSSSAAAAASNGANAGKLKDQRMLSLKDNVELFLTSVSSLAIRASADLTQPLAFDKDDDDALDFVTASSNLRSVVYHIDRKTRFEVKQMAGNIIPAIASTNAIIAGMLVLQAMHALSGDWDKLRFVSLARANTRMLASWVPSQPNPRCGVCQDLYIPIEVGSLEEVTLEQVVDKVARETLELDEEEELVVYNGNKILADPDFDENLAKSLKDLGVEQGSIITITDEDQKLQVINVIISVSINAEAGGEGGMVKVKVLVSNPPKPKLRPKSEQDTANNASSTDDEDDEEDEITVVETSSLPTTAKVIGKKRPLPSDHDESQSHTKSSSNEHSNSNATPEKKQKLHPSSSSNPTNNNDGTNANSAIELD